MLKYHQIAKKIEKYIEEKQLNQGDKLPVLETWMTHFDVSKSTIIKALELLDKNENIFQIRGSGIFVRKLKRTGYISLQINDSKKKDNVSSKLLELDLRKPTKEVANNLNIGMDEDVYYVKRIRYIFDQPFCIEESYFNKSVVTYLNKEIVLDSIFKYLQDALNVKIVFYDSYLHVDKLNEEEAEHLGLKPGDPKLLVDQTFHLSNGQPFDFARNTYNYLQSQFFIQGKGQYI
ncbi:GntR family transcriptional regulator [Paenibacillus sp. Aloe-11]|uniref:GntR family transcriptional regulator n=1 Tax=Paenibacillus sp. Aloe-11 TaxID=1050222 RepID=UPI00024F0841|nr:GntR family transcriptional regulator [Paenibacillus sp. Aloe-11]EHS54998.1 GntR family transcriptional regulator [Paenibacillus sp. Aloe-11]